MTVTSYDPPATLVTVTNYQPDDDYHTGNDNYQSGINYVSGINYQPESNYQLDSIPNYVNIGSTSIVTVSAHGDGSSSPQGSDTTDGVILKTRFNKKPNSGQDNSNSNNKYKYSRTYISQDTNSEPHLHNTILVENSQRDNNYVNSNNLVYNPNKIYTSSIHRSYSKNHSTKEQTNNGLLKYDSEDYESRPSPTDYDRRAFPDDCEKSPSLDNGWDESVPLRSQQHR